MKNFFAFAFVALFFVACKKEEAAVVDETLTEKNISNVSYGTDTAQRMDVYLPAGRTTTATKAVIMIHGGGWVSGNKVDMNQFIPVLKSRLPDYAIFNIGYRLVSSSATAFPTQENDVKAAVNSILAKVQEYKFNSDKVVVLGASAGGHLALLQAYKYSTPKMKAVVDFFGPTDIPALYSFYATQPLNLAVLQAVMGGTPATNAAMYQSSSPVNFVSSQSQPTLILHGTADPLVPIAQSTALKAKLETAGVYVKMVSYAGAGHGDWNTATFNDAYDQVVNFLKEKNP